jgi:hypothetical protein
MTQDFLEAARTGMATHIHQSHRGNGAGALAALAIFFASLLLVTRAEATDSRAWWMAPDLISAREIARVEMDSAESKLERVLADPALSYSRQEKALLILLARTRPIAAQRIARRILSGEIHPYESELYSNSLIRDAAIALAVAGDGGPLIELAEAAPTEDDAWALASIGDFRFVHVFDDDLKRPIGQRFCNAARVSPILLGAPRDWHDKLVDALLEALPATDFYTSHCAKQALLQPGVSLSTREKKRLVGVIQTMLDSSDAERIERAQELFVYWQAELQDTHLDETVVRLAIPARHPESGNSAGVTTLRTGLLAWSLLKGSAVFLNGSRLDTVVPMGSIDPVRYLVGQPFSKDWPYILESLPDDTWLLLIESMGEHPDTVVDRDAKLNLMFTHKRLRKSQALMIAALRAFPDHAHSRDLLDHVLAEASALQITTLSILMPGRIPPKLLETSWRQAQNAESPWLRLAALMNAAQACGQELPRSSGLNDVSAVDAYIAAMPPLAKCRAREMNSDPDS